ncbi:lectin-like domain-containing protein [Pontibacter arcticus]|nr:cadherin domain-containing protein [Pontibacter arcticus]
MLFFFLFTCLLLLSKAAVAQTDKFACLGESVTHTFTYNGTDLSSRQWQSSVDGTTYTNISGQTASTYTFIASASDNGKHYRVRYVTTTNPNTYQYSQVLKLTVYNIPSTPVATGDSRCGSGRVYFNISGSTGRYRWYTTQTSTQFILEGNAGEYYEDATTTIEYWVSAINTSTGCESERVKVTGVINPIPNAPSVTNGSRCGSGSVALSATPAANANITRWYTAASGGTLLATNTNYNTGTITTTTTYYVSSYNTTTGCESTTRTAVTATVNSIPTAPSVISRSRCGSGPVMLSAAGAATGNTYRWYTVSTGGTPISGATAANYTTPTLTATTTYYVATYNGTCDSERIAVTATINALPTAVYSSNNVYARLALSSGRSVARVTSGSFTGAAVTGTPLPGFLTLNTSTGEITVNSNTIVSGNYAHTIKFSNTAGCTIDVPVTINITDDQYQASGNAIKTGTNCYQLTTATGNQQGQVWSVSTINLNKSFEITFNANFGTSDAGADGIAFGFQRVASNPVYASGAIGLGLGFQGITPSFGVEFDTYQNGSEPAFDHTNFFWNGSVTNSSEATTTSTAPVQMSSTNANVEDGANHAVKIVWNRETNTMSVYFQNVLRTEYTGDIVTNIFSNNANVYFGYTASTGGSVNQHSVCEIKFNETPIITSNGGGSTASVSVPENSTTVTTVASTDAENNTRTYSIVGGADATKFAINATTGALTFVSAPNFEEPASSAGTNAYLVTVRVTETGSATSFDEQAITVNVTNVNEAPSQPADINTAANTVQENSSTGTLVGITARSTDPDAGTTLTYSLTDNAGGRFAINATTGLVTVANGALLDFETAASHTITVRASDGALTSSQTFTIAVTNVNEAPVATNVAHTTPIINTSAFENLNGILTATDPDGEQPVTFRLSNLPVTTIGVLRVDGTVANTTTDYAWALRDKFSFDPVNTATADVVFNYTVKDAGGLTSNSATYTIPLNDYPRSLSRTNATTLLNSVGITAIDALTATDSDGTISRFRISLLPTAAQGVLYVNGSVATTSQYYDWATLRDKLSFDPASPNTADATFRFTVVDSENGETPDVHAGTITIPINAAPVAKSFTTQKILNTAGETTIVITATNYPTDEDIATASILFTTVPNPSTQGTLKVGGVSVVANTPYPATSFAGGITFTPVLTNMGDVTFNYKVRDNDGAESSVATITIPINGEPVANNIITNPIPGKPVTAPISPLTASDPDGSIVSYTLSTLPGNWLGTLFVNGVEATVGQVLTPAQAAQLSFRPAINYKESVTFTFTATDTEGASDSSPAVYTIPVELDIDLTVTHTILTSAPYVNGQDIVIRITASNISNYDVYDGAQVVNLLPAGLTYVRHQTDNQLNNNAQTYTNGAWQPNWGVIRNGTSFYIDITARINTTNDITQTVTIQSPNQIDFNSTNNSTTYTLRVNIAPVAANITTAAMPSSAPATSIFNLSATDAKGDVTGFKFVSLPLSTQGVLAVNGVAADVNKIYTLAEVNNLLTFDPSGNSYGNFTFSYVAVDSDGSDSNTATYTIPVTNVGPVAVAVTNALLLNTAPATLLSSLNASDTDGPISKFKIKTLPAAAAGVLTVNGNPANTSTEYDWADREKISFDPAFANSADAVFTYSVIDNGGLESAAVNFTIPINVVPIAVNMINNKMQNTFGNTLLSTNIFGITDPDGSIVSFRITHIPSEAQGKLTIGGVEVVLNTDYQNNQSGAGRFDPDVNNFDDVIIRYVIKDNEGALSEEATITIPINGTPTASARTNATTLLDTDGPILLDAIQGQDSDSDPKYGGFVSSFKLSVLPTSGQLTINGVNANLTTDYPWSSASLIRFDPAPGVSANQTFRYTVKDNEGAVSNAATFTIPINAVPVAQNIIYEPAILMPAGAAIYTTLNPLAATDDVTTTTFTFSLSNLSASRGTWMVGNALATEGQSYPWSARSTIKFKPNSGDLTDVVFNYTVKDSEGAVSNVATYTIPLNDEPVAQNVTNAKPLSSSAGKTLLSTLAGTDSDGTIRQFQFKTLPPASQGILYVGPEVAVINKDYSWMIGSTVLQFDPAYGNENNVVFTFTVKDNDDAYDATPATFTIPIILDYDVDGIADNVDLDDDNDGIPDSVEGTGDKDGDGIPNHLDLDSDGDGILDAVEANSGIVPANFNMATGRFSGSANANGVVFTFTNIPDTDGDGLADYLDIDSDNDGILDNLEAQTTGSRLMAKGTDTNPDRKDGIDDSFKGTNAITPVDTDGDGIADYLDLDSDGDLISDTAEAYDLNGDKFSVDDLKALVNSFISRANLAGESLVAGYYNLADANKNYTPDMFEDPNTTNRFNFLTKGNSYYRDSNNNGLVDLFDTNTRGEDNSSRLSYTFRDKGVVTPLPVTLIRFTATAQGAAVSINWETATEVNNDYFMVERSLDGSTFREVAKVKGAGNSSQKLAYAHLDKQAPAGILYYRLKQVDFNGTYKYSQIASVEKTEATTANVLLYPNPATAYIKLNLAGMPNTAYQIRLLSMDGRLIQTISTKDNAELEINVQSLATGKYIFQIQSEKVLKTASFIKK